MAEELQPTQASDFRRRATFTVKIDKTLTVELRKSDMMTMIMNDAMPLPLLEAAMNFEKQLAENETERKAKGLPSLTNVEQYNAVDKKLMAQMFTAMRHYAVIHCVRPRFVFDEDDKDPSHLPVTMLSGDQLLSIFYASPPGEEKEAAVIEKDEAIAFRGPEPVDLGDVGPTSPTIRGSAKLLDLPGRQAITA